MFTLSREAEVWSYSIAELPTIINEHISISGESYKAALFVCLFDTAFTGTLTFSF
jgi:hypothetical protein